MTMNLIYKPRRGDITKGDNATPSELGFMYACTPYNNSTTSWFDGTVLVGENTNKGKKEN